MNIEDLHIAFKIELDKSSSFGDYTFAGNPSFLPGEIDYWLNKALMQTINTKFTGNNKLQQAFETSVKRTTDLERLIKTDSGINLITDSGSNKVMLTNFATEDVPDPTIVRMFYIQSVLVFGTKRVNVDLVNHEQAKRFLKTYNNNPWIPTPVATIHNNMLTIYVDTTTMVGPYTLDLTYVKEPLKFSYTNLSEFIELPDYVYNEIVSTAIALALDNIESKRVGTKLELNNIIE